MQFCQNEEEWKEARKGGIGASEAATLFGEGYDSALELYCDKLGIGEDDDSGSEAMDWGHRLEPKIAERFQEIVADEGFTLRDLGRYTIAWSVEHPFLFATLDRLVLEDDLPVAVLEIKKVSAFLKDDWKDGPPIHVRIQVQQQLLVSGLRTGYVAALFDGSMFLWWQVDRDDMLISDLIVRAKAFMERVASRDAPAPDGTDGSGKALKRMFPKSKPGTTVALAGEALDWDGRLTVIKESIKNLEEKKKELENFFKGAIGDAEVGVLPNGVRYTWKWAEKAGYSVAPSSGRTLRRSEGKG